jgi:hypothetical protein
MAAVQRDTTIKAVADAIAAKQPTAQYEAEIIDNFDAYVKHPALASLPIPFLLKLARADARKVQADAVCQLFVDVVPYAEYAALQLLELVNFSNVSTSTLLQMREISMSDGQPLRLPLVVELINLRATLQETQQCVGPRIHEYNYNDQCIKCQNGKCPYGKNTGQLTNTHTFGVDGRCTVCGFPRCRFDNLHPFNYDGHCHICGKAQPSKCEIVGCMPTPDGTKCAICGKPIQKA